LDDHTKERWFQLCELAAVEQDNAKLIALVTEINQLLEAEETDRNKGRARQIESWKQIAESDQHQTNARQPYLSREHQSDATSNEPSKPPLGSDSFEDSE
jgi:hypothetical protein